MSGTRVESVCVFGSHARCSRDQYSDQDVLVVCDDRNRLKQLRDHWCYNGWSVSAYSSGRFLKMARSGSLFVQHLKLEGDVVEDREGWLRRLLDQALPKNTYRHDAAESVNLALPLERFFSDSQVCQNLVVADIAYVAVRNFGICHLADRGEFTFDYSDIIESLKKEFILNERDSKILKCLRPAKVAYRKGAEYSQVLGTVQEVRNLLSTFFPHRPLREINRSASVRQLGSGYSTLRDFEALTISRLNGSTLNWQLSSLGLEEIWKWVCDPRSYAWNVRNFDCQSIGHLKFNQAFTLKDSKNLDLIRPKN